MLISNEKGVEGTGGRGLWTGEEENERIWRMRYFGEGRPERSAMLVVKGKYLSVTDLHEGTGKLGDNGQNGMSWEGRGA